MSESVLIIVEDDPDLLQGWIDLFEFTGHTVHSHSTASAALADHEGLGAAHVLITDYHLPDMNGLDLIRQARKQRSDLPAVVLTGLKQEHVFESINNEPDVALFYKPIAIDKLEAHIEALIA